MALKSKLGLLFHFQLGKCGGRLDFENYINDNILPNCLTRTVMEAVPKPKEFIDLYSLYICDALCWITAHPVHRIIFHRIHPNFTKDILHFMASCLIRFIVVKLKFNFTVGEEVFFLLCVLDVCNSGASCEVRWRNFPVKITQKWFPPTLRPP